MSKIIIPKQITFNLPEGNYKAKLVNQYDQSKQTKKTTQSFIRLVFEVDVPGMENVTSLAGRKYEAKLNPGSDLRNILESWLGSEYLLRLSGKQLDFDELLGKSAEVTLRHFQGKEFEKPLVIIDGIFPPGTLKLTETETNEIKDTTETKQTKETPVIPKD